MVESSNFEPPSARPDAPRGVFKVSVDEKGRLKLPAAIADFLRTVGETKVFITTLDKKEARIYPVAVWSEKERMLEQPGDDFPVREHMKLVADAYGKDDTVDAQGRVTLPGNLRKLLGLEKEEAYVRWYQGHLKVLNGQDYERRLAEAETNLEDKLRELQKKGL